MTESKDVFSYLVSKAEIFPNSKALRWKEGIWKEVSYAEFFSRVEEIARALLAIGISKGDRVVFWADNCAEWIWVDLAVLSIGAVTVPIYATSSDEAATFILSHCEPKIIFADRKKKVQSLAVRIELKSNSDSWNQFLQAGTKISQADFENRRDQIVPSDLATIIYTSGTTGNPKGVMLSHRNLLSNVEASAKCFDVRVGDRSLSFLPFSHALERTIGLFLMLSRGVTISLVEDLNLLASYLEEVKPTIFITVPRMLEKFHARVEEALHQRPKLIQKLFRVACSGRGKCVLGTFYDKFFFQKIRNKLGGALRLIVSGGAPLSSSLAKFFPTIGIPLLEGYGLTETSPVVAVNRVGKTKVGTVGLPLPNVQVAISGAGEILVKGDNVMLGYFKDDVETKKAIDPDGWFHTGDIGELDQEGFLKITDRIKDLLVTSGGKKVSPQPIENALKTHSLVGQICLVGDRRPFVAALIVPNFEVLEKKLHAEGVGFSSREELIEHPLVRRWYEDVVAQVNESLARYETIKTWKLLSREWTIETGELTPTLKVRRKVIQEHFSAELEKLYSHS